MAMALRALIGALVAGAVGAAIWGAISYYTHYETGWIAWGIGALVGLGAHVGTGGQGGGVAGLVAGVVAVASVLGGKYAVVEIVGNAEIKQAHADVDVRLAEMFQDESSFKVHMAHQLVDEASSCGKTLKWPEGKSDDEAEKLEDFPTDISKDVEARWKAMPADAKKEYCEQTKEAAREGIHGIVDSLGSAAKGEGFMASFSLWDVLWLGLALMTGARFGSGGTAEA
jgi:hypothetical protein